MTLLLPRRQFLRVLTGLVAAPAVVKAESLMNIVAPKPEIFYVSELRNELLACASGPRTWRRVADGAILRMKESFLIENCRILEESGRVSELRHWSVNRLYGAGAMCYVRVIDISSSA